MSAGKFIVLDGLDGSGKATQTKLLVEALVAAGQPAVAIDFPRYETNFFGQLLAECLAGQHGSFPDMDPKIASLPYALDRVETTPRIEEWLREGKVVVADRFSSANQIHQGGKIADLEERRAFLSWLDRMEHDVLRVPRPDMVVYLRMPIEATLNLLSRERAKKNALLDGKDTVEKDQRYIEGSFASAELLAEEGGWKVVECVEGGEVRPRDEIHLDVLALARTLLAS